MTGEEVLRVLLLYHLMEALQGAATRIEVAIEDGVLVTRDDGRGMGIDREVAGRPYVDLVLGQLELFDGEGELDPQHLQLHAIGLSVAAAHCESFELAIERAGERKRGGWDPSTSTMRWAETEPTERTGTELQVKPSAGLPSDGEVRALIESLRARCSEVELSFSPR